MRGLSCCCFVLLPQQSSHICAHRTASYNTHAYCVSSSSLSLALSKRAQRSRFLTSHTDALLLGAERASRSGKALSTRRQCMHSFFAFNQDLRHKKYRTRRTTSTRAAEKCEAITTASMLDAARHYQQPTAGRSGLLGWFVGARTTSKSKSTHTQSKKTVSLTHSLRPKVWLFDFDGLLARSLGQMSRTRPVFHLLQLQRQAAHIAWPGSCRALAAYFNQVNSPEKLA